MLSKRKCTKEGGIHHKAQHHLSLSHLIFCRALIKLLSPLMNVEGNLEHLNVHLIALALEASLSKSCEIHFLMRLSDARQIKDHQAN